MRHIDVLSLEVQDDPAGTENLTPNPTGELGGWGWITPVAGSTVRRAEVFTGGFLPTPELRFTGNGAGSVPYMLSEPIPIAPGQWFGASWLTNGCTGGASTGTESVRARIDWLKADGTANGNTALNTAVSALTITRKSVDPGQAPAGTASAQLRIFHYKDGVLLANANRAYRYRLFTIAVAATSAAVTGLPWIDPPTYTNILGPVHEITTDRTPLGANTLEATILDTTLDPATAATLRPGRKIRLHAFEQGDSADPRPIFTGEIASARVDYDLRAPAGRDTRISIVAIDAAASFGNIVRTGGVATIDGLRTLLEGAGVPWNIGEAGPHGDDATTGQLPTIATINPRADSKLLDQIILTRDSNVPSYAWINASNVFRAGVGAAGFYDEASDTAIDEDDFSDIEIAFDSEEAINEVTITALATSTETTHGPYRDLAAQRTWKNVRAAEFKIHYPGTTAAVDTLANAVLTRMANPQRRVRSVRLPINTTADIVERKALADLYRHQSVSCTSKGLAAQALAIVGLRHTIGPETWLLDVSYMPVDHVPAPTASA